LSEAPHNLQEAPVTLKKMITVIFGMASNRWHTFEAVREQFLKDEGTLVSPATVQSMCRSLNEKGYLRLRYGAVRWSA